MFKYSYTYDKFGGYFESNYDLDLDNICNYTNFHKIAIVAKCTPVLLARAYALPFDESHITVPELLSMVKIRKASK